MLGRLVHHALGVREVRAASVQQRRARPVQPDAQHVLAVMHAVLDAALRERLGQLRPAHLVHIDPSLEQPAEERRLGRGVESREQRQQREHEFLVGGDVPRSRPRARGGGEAADESRACLLSSQPVLSFDTGGPGPRNSSGSSPTFGLCGDGRTDGDAATAELEARRGTNRRS